MHGAFIGPNVVLTAAHCLYDPAFGGWVAGVLVAPGKDGAAEPYGGQAARRIYTPAQWRADPSPGSPYDFGLLVMPSSALGDAVGPMRLGVLTAETLRRADFGPVVSGYPEQHAAGSYAEQWRAAAPGFTVVEPSRLGYADAVLERTDEVVGHVDPVSLDEVVDRERIRRVVAEEGVLAPAGAWEEELVLAGKQRAWLLLFFGLTHNAAHWSDIGIVRGLIGFPGR